MKKVLSMICVLALLVCMAAVGTVSSSAAVTEAKTVVNVKAGNEVSYVLKLGDVPEKIIGFDFSVYYDPDVFTLSSVADFTNSTDENYWSVLINYDLNGEIRGNWTHLNGIDFSSTENFCTVNLKAKKDASTHITYYIRYMYDNHVFDSADQPQISQYTFTCDVKVNGSAVLEDAQPELNIVTPQEDVGTFTNSVTGKSADADPTLVDRIPSAYDNNNGNSGSGNGSGSGDNGNSGNDGSGNGSGSGDNGSSDGNNGNGSGSGDNGASTVPESSTAPDASAISGDTPTTADGQPVDQGATSDERTPDQSGSANANTGSDTEDNSSSGGNTWLWIVIAAIVILSGGGIALYFLLGKKKQ